MATVMAMERKKKVELRGLVRQVYKNMGKAIADYNMLNDKDRVLVAVSGGLDSLSLLKLFQMRQERIPIRFEIIACFVDANFIKVDADCLTGYFKDSGVEYVAKKMFLEENEINCFWCSWNRRKILFETAKEYNCNKVALGHNLDDISETILMNLCFFGEVSSAPPALEMFKGKIKIIRPLCYVAKKDITYFSSKFSFPDTHYECVYGKNTRRQLIKETIKNLEKNCPYVKKNIFRALKKIRKDYLV
jgi:tRNA(Ile)-lysidine synthase TilS/MesJ